MTTIFQLFDIAIQRQASDIHLIPGYFPSIRINNELSQLRTTELLTQNISNDLIFSLLLPEQKEFLINNKELDFGYQYKDSRFRCNVYMTKGKYAAAFRLINNSFRTIEDLMLPQVFHQITDYSQGLVLITGPTGEGKSTTLASVINEINNKYSKHIITIEDPIEYVYTPAKSIISQRELLHDTHSWDIALKSVLREDPDVVLIGEMRDYDTIQSVLTIAETGHLVFATLHTGSTPETINRIIDVFPSHQQSQVRSQLASVLRVVIAQRLLPNLDNTKRVPACEVLFNIPSVASVIRDGKSHMLDNMLETGESEGLYLFEKSIIDLYEKGIITKEIALQYAIRPDEIIKLMK